MQHRCDRGATEVQQRCNRGATTVHNGDASKSAMRAELRRQRRGVVVGGWGSGADAVKTCSDCSDGGSGAGAGRADQDDAGGDRSRQAARPVAAGHRSPARHAVDAAATAPTSCRPGPALLRLRRSLRRHGPGGAHVRRSSPAQRPEPQRPATRPRALLLGWAAAVCQLGQAHGARSN